ncbi:hypothetical protein CC80DRAFT_547013 [Byssothecium circinans]|uniref:EF-hand domain-containing protein n=1 Tax=Byssothecium circinans TaxID=147558 RepID=A0A6A5TZU0_9PLEO|nr:hypothetical protein CC80DRAFT_547013 [Byssothecium circinans]
MASVSIGDLILLGQIAFTAWDAFQKAGEEYRYLAQLCQSIHLAIKDIPEGIPEKQGAVTLDLVTTGLREALAAAEKILGNYEDMDRLTLRSIRKRISFSLATTSDRETIEKRLALQLHTLSVFLGGKTLEYQSLTAKLLMWLVDERQSAKGEKIDVNKIVDDQVAFQELLDQLDVRDAKTKETLQLSETQDKIKTKLAEEGQHRSGHSSGTSVDKAEKQDSTSQSTASKLLLGPSATKFQQYYPLAMRWFAEIQPFFSPLTVQDACWNKPYLSNPTIRYSERDEFLCPFQEGWTLNRTYADRLGVTAEEAYYFSYNGLSCESTRSIKTSRLYFCRSALIPDMSLPPGHRVLRNYANLPGSPGSPGYLDAPDIERRFLLNKFFISHGVQAQYPNPNIVLGSWYLGYSAQSLHRDPNNGPNCRWPFDLDDEVTKEFVFRHFGNRGGPVPYPDNWIDASLPPGWVWKKDATGNGRHVYIYLGDKRDGRMEHTMHPSRFHREGMAGTVRLPPNWDRRLDCDGNLFFVDHNTQSATRIDPRFNKTVDQETGLPLEWRQVKDNKERPWYYIENGGTVIATIKPASMSSKSLDWKIILTQVPKEGQNMAEIFADEKHNQYFQQLPSDMTPQDRERYDKIFRKADKEGKCKITWDQALRNFHAAGLSPDLYIPVLSEADKDLDKVFTPSEYANALHRMRSVLQGWYKSQPNPSLTPEKTIEYENEFKDKKSRDALEISLEEVKRLTENSNHYGLPSDATETIWENYMNRDTRNLDIVGFCRARQAIDIEVEQWKSLAKLGGPELNIPPVKPPAEPDLEWKIYTLDAPSNGPESASPAVDQAAMPGSTESTPSVAPAATIPTEGAQGG